MVHPVARILDPCHDTFLLFEGGEEARKCPFDAIHDTEAFVAANDDIIAVVFRGTKTIDNWYTNFMLSTKTCPSEWGVPSPGGQVHQVGYCDSFVCFPQQRP